MSRFVKLTVALAAFSVLAACSGDDKTIKTSVADPNAGAGQNQSSGYSSSAVTPGSLADFQQNVGDRVFFGYDQHMLSYDAQDTLGKQADWLKQYASNAQIIVEGHCDERGTREYNIALGARRAVSARNYLVSKGVNAGNIKAVSYGKERPAVEGSNETAWGQNRRAVTTVEGLN